MEEEEKSNQTVSSPRQELNYSSASVVTNTDKTVTTFTTITFTNTRQTIRWRYFGYFWRERRDYLGLFFFHIYLQVRAILRAEDLI